MTAANETVEFDPNAPHHQKPKLRRLQPFHAKQGDQPMLGLTDPSRVTEQVMLVPPVIQTLLPHLDGRNTLDDIVNKVGRGLTRENLERMVAQFDQVGFLEGPRYEALFEQMKEKFDSSPNLPPATTAQFADMLVVAKIKQEKGEEAMPSEEEKAELGPELIRETFDGWMKQVLEPAPDPSFDELPRAIFAPHLDYARGFLNYASVYGRMRVVDRPDRVIVLGTNHNGRASGVCGCDKGFETPLGTCEYDAEFASLLSDRLGEENSSKLFEQRFDHESEWSIELHMPWVQHVFGGGSGGSPPRVFAALVHDPVVNGGKSYDGNGLDLDPFVEAMKSAIAEAPGRTLVVSSCDLSHVGRQFGDQQTIAGDTEEAKQFRNRVVQHDQSMLKLVENAAADELITSMAWQQNPTRWCSVGNIVAALRITDAEQVKILNYGLAGDQQGMAAVSSFSGAVV